MLWDELVRHSDFSRIASYLFVYCLIGMYIISSEKERGWFLLIPTIWMLAGSKRCSSERREEEVNVNGCKPRTG